MMAFLGMNVRECSGMWGVRMLLEIRQHCLLAMGYFIQLEVHGSV